MSSAWKILIAFIGSAYVWRESFHTLQNITYVKMEDVSDKEENPGQTDSFKRSKDVLFQ